MSEKVPRLKVEPGHEQIDEAFVLMEAALKESMHQKYGEFERAEKLRDCEIDIELVFRLARVGLRTAEYYQHLSEVARIPDVLQYIVDIHNWFRKQKGSMTDTSVPASEAVDNLLKGLFE